MRRIVSILAFMLAAEASATNYYAVVGGAGTKDGSSWENGHPDVQALAQSLFPTPTSVTNELWVGAGTWIMTNEMRPVSNIWIRGTNRELVLLSGNNTCRVVNVSAPNVRLDSLTITNGRHINAGLGYAHTNCGGGIRAQPTTVITNCTIVGNVATGYNAGGVSGGNVYDSAIIANVAYNDQTKSFGGYGGGAHWSKLWRTVVSGNVAYTYGSGLHECTSFYCTVANNVGAPGVSSTHDVGSKISGHFASGGGGASASVLVGSTIAFNGAYYRGGGILTSTASNCVIVSNYNTVTWGTTYSGGGASQSTLYNCRLEGNRSPILGGGASECALYGCVLVSNKAPAYPAAANLRATVNCDFFGHTNAAPLVQYTNAYVFANNILWNNASNEVYNTTNAFNNWTNDPMFLGDSSFPWKIAQESPCIDAGMSSLVPAALQYDFYGRTRISGYTVDVGAVEFQIDLDVPDSTRKKFFWSFM